MAEDQDLCARVMITFDFAVYLAPYLQLSWLQMRCVCRRWNEFFFALCKNHRIMMGMGVPLAGDPRKIKLYHHARTSRNYEFYNSTLRDQLRTMSRDEQIDLLELVSYDTSLTAKDLSYLFGDEVSSLVVSILSREDVNPQFTADILRVVEDDALERLVRDVGDYRLSAAAYKRQLPLWDLYPVNRYLWYFRAGCPDQGPRPHGEFMREFIRNTDVDVFDWSHMCNECILAILTSDVRFRRGGFRWEQKCFMRIVTNCERERLMQGYAQGSAELPIKEAPDEHELLAAFAGRAPDLELDDETFNDQSLRYLRKLYQIKPALLDTPTNRTFLRMSNDPNAEAMLALICGA